MEKRLNRERAIIDNSRKGNKSQRGNNLPLCSKKAGVVEMTTQVKKGHALPGKGQTELFSKVKIKILCTKIQRIFFVKKTRSGSCRGNWRHRPRCFVCVCLGRRNRIPPFPGGTLFGGYFIQGVGTQGKPGEIVMGGSRVGKGGHGVGKELGVRGEPRGRVGGGDDGGWHRIQVGVA